MKLPASPEKEKSLQGRKKEATPSPGLGQTGGAQLLGHTPPLTKRPTEEEVGGSGRKRYRKGQPTESVVPSQVLALAGDLSLAGRLSEGGPASLGENTARLLLEAMTRLPTALTGSAFTQFVSFTGRLPAAVPRLSANPAPQANLQIISLLSDFVAAAAPVSTTLAEILLMAMYELLKDRDIIGAIPTSHQPSPPRGGGPGPGSGEEDSEEEDRELVRRGAATGAAQRGLSRDSRGRERSPLSRRARSESFSGDRSTSSSSEGSEPPSPTVGGATSARRVSRSPDKGATWPAPLYPTPRPTAAANPPMQVAAPPRVAPEVDSPFFRMDEDEVDFEPTPERFLTAEDDVTAMEKAPPVGDRLPVHQRLGTATVFSERRPISERLSGQVQEPRVPVADRLGPTNSRPRVQDRLDFSRAPSPGDEPTVTIGDRLLSLASEEENREELALEQQFEGIPSPTPGVQLDGTPEPDDGSVKTKRSRFDERPSFLTALEAELRYISAQRLLQKHRLAEKTWSAYCDDPNNMCPGRAEDLDCLEGILFQIAEAEAECERAKWEFDFAKVREQAQAKAAAAAASVSTISLGSGFEQGKKKRPANRRGGKGRKPAKPPSFARPGAGKGGSKTAPLKRSSTSTSVVTTAEVSASIKTVSRTTRWDK
ncbi:hypothetical protein KFL_017080020 [Klebsormidium nitens]|uniref:Uncharacterized protein n=1 Tax=Klebsormidium nitens TaxID=105231 RepID=A0A1Y1ISE2_KLENI|nr:hypothetical protein KFL_017080020 [Klebsormidium nitens]|eukprot:GAQ93613.1 hypothetical protein KFL_017080020 [Klebsormidium nitens]